jgi:hypothetical protein
MANRKFWLGMLVMALVFGMTVVGCSDGSTGGGGSKKNNDAGALAGIWKGTVMEANATITVSNSGWTLSVPSYDYYATGSFNRKGNSATLYSNKDGKNLGTANIIDDNTIQVVLNSNSDAPGTYTLTKQ